MDPDLENVIRQALTDAKAAGKDYLSQTELAVRAVLQVRPDMTASDALAAVNLARRPRRQDHEGCGNRPTGGSPVHRPNSQSDNDWYNRRLFWQIIRNSSP